MEKAKTDSDRTQSKTSKAFTNSSVVSKTVPRRYVFTTGTSEGFKTDILSTGTVT